MYINASTNTNAVHRIRSEWARERERGKKAHKYVFLCGVAFEYDLVSNRTIAVAVIHRHTYRTISTSFFLHHPDIQREQKKRISIWIYRHVDTEHNKESCAYITHSRKPIQGRESSTTTSQQIVFVWQGWKRFSLDCYAHTKYLKH